MEENLEPQVLQEEAEDEAVENDVTIVTFKDGKAGFAWSAVSGLISNPELEESTDVVESIQEYLKTAVELYGSYGYDSIPVTPEGPFLEGSTTDGASVSWALNTLYAGEFDVDGPLPTLKDLGLDYASNFDEDGNPLVR